jgi:glycerol-3-phosphate dehydrogenase
MTSGTESMLQQVPTHTHGLGGVYYGGSWLDMEDSHLLHQQNHKNNCYDCPNKTVCPRSQSRNSSNSDTTTYDVVLIGAGCVGAAIARELSKCALKIMWLEAADDVSQGATKGNSGIVHAGYDDTPGSNRAKYCWKGERQFSSALLHVLLMSFFLPIYQTCIVLYYKRIFTPHTS